MADGTYGYRSPAGPPAYDDREPAGYADTGTAPSAYVIPDSYPPDSYPPDSYPPDGYATNSVPANSLPVTSAASVELSGSQPSLFVDCVRATTVPERSGLLAQSYAIDRWAPIGG